MHYYCKDIINSMKTIKMLIIFVHFVPTEWNMVNDFTRGHKTFSISFLNKWNETFIGPKEICLAEELHLTLMQQ